MKKRFTYSVLLLLAAGIISCNKSAQKETNMDVFENGTFGYDLKYLAGKDSIILLSSLDGQAQVIVSPKYQGKVFTSSAGGLEGKSLGFVNYKALEAETIDPHMNGYGGENRFWLGPEGGKYSVFFQPLAEQRYDNWHTPPPFDTESWEIAAADQKNAALKKEMEVTNYLGTRLKLQINRHISLIEPSKIEAELNIELNPEIKTVAYATHNSITNLNDFEWTEKTGTICIWILDMFIPSPRALTIIPYNEGNESERGKILTSDYFGEIPSDRLKIKNNTIYLKTDGKYRSKLGLNGKRARTLAANYDPDAQRLTLVAYDVDPDAVYLNQEWNPEKDPLNGDAMNAYNDGPLEDGSIMGPFLELESVSPAAFLQPAQSLSHKHSVYHFIAEENALNPLAEKLFGISIHEMKKIFDQQESPQPPQNLQH
ncbi:MAG: hypothetical protein LBP83_08390 [Dysgonamonadaceae bacterium]|jgi:hypothetical protein|nr:hypothetical protein [Dysgonamonadaceae bacterium]